MARECGGGRACCRPVSLAGITSEEEEAQLESLNEWMEATGLPRGVVAYDFSDPQSGEQKAVFDLVWPNGIQEKLSQPVAVLLNEEGQTLAFASQAGFRCFNGYRRVQALRHRRESSARGPPRE